MKRRTLPPLNALRAFESAARHLSVSKAAQELNVSPAAISHQIRLLEDLLGLPLFERSGRGLVLTDAGAAGLDDLQEAFHRLYAAMDAVDSLGEMGTLRVSVAPSFATKWLLPRLGRFSERFPDIDVHVVSTMKITDFARGKVDIAIRYGAGHYPDLTSERLMTESVVPVCSPLLVRDFGPFETPDDLRRVTLLHDESPDNDPSCPNWDMWLRASRVESVDATRGMRLNQSSLVIEAAIHGRGVALAKSTLAEDDIRSGRLVVLFRNIQPVGFSYFIVAPVAKLNLPKVSFFRDWLLEECSGAPEAAMKLSA